MGNPPPGCPKMPQLFPPVLAAAFILIGAADFELVATRDGREVERICAKTQTACETAKTAIWAGWIAPELRDDELNCRPAPAGCFSERSNCIAGFNCVTGTR